MIPETKQVAVTHALQTAFGVNDYEDIQVLTGGLSTALAFKIIVKENPYLLKILRTEIISDPAKEFACMQTAGEAGIAPRVWYANVEDRVLITDFVEAKPFPEDMTLRMASTLRTLHALPGFPKMTAAMNYLDAMNGLAQRFQAAKLLPDSTTDELFRRYAEVVKVYPRSDSELVACHNDLKPQNMRFDGTHLWLVDWESGFLNDRYVDLAIAANFFVRDEAEEELYLNTYFGETAGDYQRAHFYLMRQTLSIFYTSLLLLEAARAGLPLDPYMPTPNFRDYHNDLILDKIDMLTPEAKLQYGLIHLREALQNMRTPRFAEALATVGGFHASA